MMHATSLFKRNYHAKAHVIINQGLYQQMKKLFSKTLTILILCFGAHFSSCKVKKQITTDNTVARRSTSKISDNEQTKADLIQQSLDSSITLKKDSAIISVTEKQDIEYDYNNTLPLQPSKIIHHIEKTTNFKGGSHLIQQNNIKSTTAVDLRNSKKKNETQTTKANERQHSSVSITSSSNAWIWLFISLLLIITIGIYLIKRFNLANLIKTAVSEII